MRLRSGRVIAGWSAIMIGFALTGVLLTTSGSQARHADASVRARTLAASARDASDSTPMSAASEASGTSDGSVEAFAGKPASASTAPGDSAVEYAGNAHSGDSFNALVRDLQSRDGIENTSPPFMWLASLAVSVARPAGVLGVRLATFEGARLADVTRDRDFESLISRASADGWTPMVRVRSKRNNELVSIHARTRGDNVSLLVVTVDKGEAVVVQVALKPDVVAEWLKEPGGIEARLR